MSALPNPERWTVEAYLAFELGNEIRHEYFEGEIYVKLGESRYRDVLPTAKAGGF